MINAATWRGVSAANRVDDANNHPITIDEWQESPYPCRLR